MLSLFRKRFAAGDAVRVTDGPFTGSDAVVVKVNLATVCVRLTVAGRSFDVQMAPRCIEKA